MKESNKYKVNLLIFMVIVLILLGLVFVLKAKAQEGVFQGGESTNGDYNVSFTIGQTFFLNTVGETQGMQQTVAVPDTVHTTVENKILKNLKIYPNPCTHYVRVETLHELEFEIYDIYGKLLKHGRAEDEIDVSTFIPAPYFLKLKEGNNVVKTTKLLKR